jgi:hypothetical protein
MLDAAAPAVVYQINVTNTGAVAAANAVLGFLTPHAARRRRRRRPSEGALRL